MDGEGSLHESQSHPDLMFWGSSHEHVGGHTQGIQFAGHTFDAMSKPMEAFGRVDDLLRGSGDFDPKCVDLESLNLWNNCPMDVDMNNGMDFSNNSSMLWFPEAPDAVSNPLPTPPGTSSTVHSRINSISPSWQGIIEPMLQEQTNSLPDLDGGMIPELDIVVATEESWPLAKCNPRVFSGSCPRTAIIHLQTFQSCSRLEDAWNSMNDLITPNDLGNDNGLPLTVTPLITTTRDKIIAFAQSFLLKALMTHHSGSNNYKVGGATTFFTLPPSNVLENLLRSSVRSLSPYYSLLHGTTLDPNELMLDNDTSTLLFLLMMAQGASTVPKAEARYLAAGLTETCRISLFDVIEKNVELSADPLVLKSALLFTLLGAWGGDAWRMCFLDLFPHPQFL